jgi:hypothetical protein
VCFARKLAGVSPAKSIPAPTELCTWRLGKPAPFLILVVVARWPERMKRHERHANTFDDQGCRTGIDLKCTKLAMDLNLRGEITEIRLVAGADRIHHKLILK